VAVENTRILSDLHFGDPGSRVRSLAALCPLFAGADRVVFNGDSLDTRVCPEGRGPTEYRQAFLDFIGGEVPRPTVLTGNHDADISTTHHLDLLGGVVLVTHGEILFDSLVPWGQDQPLLANYFQEELDALPPAEREALEPRLAAGKRACARLHLPPGAFPRTGWQRVRHLAGKFWPPTCAVEMARAWRRLPSLAAEFARRHRPGARFFVVGHTHLPGVWHRRGLVIINTGAFCPPFGSYAVDLSPVQVVVRRVRRDRDRFALGRVVASFALAPTPEGPAPSADTLPELAPVP